jgi:hypothetical protein
VKMAFENNQAFFICMLYILFPFLCTYLVS